MRSIQRYRSYPASFFFLIHNILSRKVNFINSLYTKSCEMKIFFGGGFPLVETELLINNSRLHIARKREALSTAIITSPLLDVAANLS